MLDVSHAFHSGLLDPMLDAAYERRASEVSYARRNSAYVNLTGRHFQSKLVPMPPTRAVTRASQCGSLHA